MKLMKKLSVFALASFIFIGGFSSVKAYEQDIVQNNNIVLNYLEAADQPYITLNGTLKNDSAKVYQQDVQLTKDQFDAIVAKAKEVEKYAAEGDDEKTTQAAAEFKALVPSFTETNWKEVAKTESTDAANRYGITVSGEYTYFVSWVKVTIGGTDYYNFDVKCFTDIPKPKCEKVNGVYYDANGNEVSASEYAASCEKVCVIEGGKYYDNTGKEVSKTDYYKACPNPKTGNNVYYIYGALTVALAFMLYMFTRRVTKFEK